MLKNSLSFINCCVIALSFTNHIGASPAINTEFYPSNAIPKEFASGSVGGDLTILSLEDWPENMKISQYETRLSKPKEKNKLGEITTQKGQTPVFAISSMGYIPGEPVTFEFADSNFLLSQKITVIPSPIYAKNLSGSSRIEAKLTMLYPANYDIVFEGFKNGEELTVKSTSYDEHMEYKIIFDKKNGMAHMPGVINKKGGVNKVEFVTQSGEIYKLELPWGLEWIKYNLFYDTDGKIKSIIEDSRFRAENPEIAKYFDSNRG